MTHPLDWQLVSSTYILQDEWISVRADRCRLPQGQLVDPFYIVETRNWVTVVPVTPAGDIVLVRLYRHGLRRTMWELPGGIIEAHELDGAETCRRELLEETGHASDEISLLGQGAPDPARYEGMSYYYLARNVIKVAEPRWDETEEMEIATFPLTEVQQMMFNGDIIDTAHQSALFFAMQALGMLSLSGEKGG